MTNFNQTDDSTIDLSEWRFGFGELDPTFATAANEVIRAEFVREPPDLDIVGWSHRDPEERTIKMEPCEIVAQLTLPLGPPRECGWCYFEVSITAAMRQGLKRAYDDMEEGEAEELIASLKAMVSVLENDLIALKSSHITKT